MRMLVWNVHIQPFTRGMDMRSLWITACVWDVLRIFARRYIFSSLARSFAGKIFFHAERNKSRKAKRSFAPLSFYEFRGKVKCARARLSLYLLYSVACQPIYIGLDSAFTSRATGTRPEEHRRGAPRRTVWFSLTIRAQLIFAKLHPRSRQARFMRARARPSSYAMLRRYVVY